MTASEVQAAIFESIARERAKQDKKWGEQNHDPEKWMLIITEEVGEVAQAILQRKPDQYLEELVQVAASAVAALESHYRQHSAIDCERDNYVD